MPFEDLAAFLAPGFDLPVGGKRYRISAPPARDGLWLQGVMDAAEQQLFAGSVSASTKTVLADDQERTAFQMALGPAFDEMLADEIPWPVLKHAAVTAILYWTRDKAAAERYWASFGDGQGNATSPETPGSPTSSDSSPTDPSTPPPD